MCSGRYRTNRRYGSTCGQRLHTILEHAASQPGALASAEGGSEMHSLTRTAHIATIVLVFSTTLFSRELQPVQTKEANGSISGRVTIDGHPARGVTVLLVSMDASSGMQRTTAKATTDQEGEFHIKGVPAGSYSLQAFAPALIASGDNRNGRRPGVSVNLAEGETAEGIEISLQPGGVITGQVTGSDGQPLVQESVWLFLVGSVDQQLGRKQRIYLPYNFMFTTDDRGVYRLFGLPPGRYIVGVGLDTSSPNARMNTGNIYYPLTYHPDVTEETKATTIDVAHGSEATGVDIVLGRMSRGYSVSGRIVDAVSGKPVVGMAYGYGARDPQSGRLNINSFTSSTTNARGEFRLEGVTPGQYAAFASPAPDSDFYSDTGPFTVSDSDISGVVVKVQVGSRIAGHVMIEGVDGQSGVPRLSEIRLGVSAGSLNVAPRSSQVHIEPDGSFRTMGLPRGIANFYVLYPAPKGVALVRTERDGVEQKNGLEVGSNEEINGVKVIFAYGAGSIRGQVKVEGGEITANTSMYLNVAKVGTNQSLQNIPGVDSRGRFVLEGLQPGEYELSLFYQTKPSTPAPGAPATISKNVKQTVTVTNGRELQVIMLVDLNETNR